MQATIAAAHPVAGHFARPGDNVGLAACVSVLGMLVSVIENHYGAEGVHALVDALSDIAPVAKESGRQFREGMN